jgi:hypothetical protein
MLGVAGWLEIGEWTTPENDLVRERGAMPINLCFWSAHAALEEDPQRGQKARQARPAQPAQAADPGQEDALCDGLLRKHLRKLGKAARSVSISAQRDARLPG